MSHANHDPAPSRDEQAPRLNRRAFCQATVALGAAGLAGGAAACGFGPAEAVAAQAKAPAGRYVDVHTHLGQVWNNTDVLPVDRLLAWMDESDVAQAVVLPLVSPESSTFLTTTDWVLTQTKPHRDRLIPFCCIDPRTSYMGGHKGLVAILQRWVDLGAKGFGEHKPGVKVDDPLNMKLYAACSELKLPIIFHLDAQRNMDAPGLPGLEKALKEFPETKFIGHGPGWWASISGDVTEKELAGYPTTAVTPGGAIDRLMDTYPNIYGDLSAASGLGAITRDPKFGREFLIRRADRLFFATDILEPPVKKPIGQIEFYRQVDLPAEVQAKIFRDNARQMLRLNA